MSKSLLLLSTALGISTAFVVCMLATIYRTALLLAALSACAETPPTPGVPDPDPTPTPLPLLNVDFDVGSVGIVEAATILDPYTNLPDEQVLQIKLSGTASAPGGSKFLVTVKSRDLRYPSGTTLGESFQYPHQGINSDDLTHGSCGALTALQTQYDLECESAGEPSKANDTAWQYTEARKFKIIDAAYSASFDVVVSTGDDVSSYKRIACHNWSVAASRAGDVLNSTASNGPCAD